MGIHLAAEGLKIEGFFGCHSNLKYTVTRVDCEHDAVAASPAMYSAQPGMQIGQQRAHLFLGEAAGKATASFPCLPAHSCRTAASVAGAPLGRVVAIEDAVQVRRNFLEREVIVFVAMGAAHLVKVLPFRLLRSERWR